jgi:hypothetical protein
VAMGVLPSWARAEVRCGNFDPRGVQLCEAGIPSLQLISARQACPQWCWAACIQMIFARYGRQVHQEWIVHRLFGDLRCSPANGPQIVAAASGTWRDISGRTFAARAYPIADFNLGISNYNMGADAAQELAAGRPLINGALGHATVMTAMTYYRAANGYGQVESITVRDPWPEAPPRRLLTAQEAGGSNLLVGMEVG